MFFFSPFWVILPIKHHGMTTWHVQKRYLYTLNVGRFSFWPQRKQFQCKFSVLCLRATITQTSAVQIDRLLFRTKMNNKKKKNLTSKQRKQLVSDMLVGCKEEGGKIVLKRGTFQETAKKFNVAR